MYTSFSKTSLQKGFTLVEMMVSIALFTVVMTAGVGTMLVVLDANRKAQSFQTAMDNLGVALEGVSRDMRVGTHYYCWGDSSGGMPFSFSGNQDCNSSGGTASAFLPLGANSGGTAFAFLPLGANSGDSTKWWVYRWRKVAGKGVLERCKFGSQCITDDLVFGTDGSRD